MDKGLKYVGDNEIIGVAKGSQVGGKLYLGNTLIWVRGYGITYSLDNVTCDGSSFVNYGESFNAALTIGTGYYLILSSVSVTMGDVDITSTAYDSTDNTITINSVTGSVIITAQATQIITFEDATVKSLCVSNWGGNNVSGEITTAEAAAVTTLSSVFQANTGITKFNELQYFIGLTTLNNAFYNCSGLTEISFPIATLTASSSLYLTLYKAHVAIADMRNMTCTQAQRLYIFGKNNYYITELYLPTMTINRMDSAFYYATKLEVLDCSQCDFSAISSDNYTSNAFLKCVMLTTITGGLPGIRRSFSLSDSPITHDSAVDIINSLSSSPVSGATVTFSSDTYSTLTAAEIAVATAKGWTVTSA